MKGINSILTLKIASSAGYNDAWVPDQHGLQSKFQERQGYTEKLCLNNIPLLSDPVHNKIANKHQNPEKV